eukprot:TRINITY_DN10232_c0_g1_i5.p1 TRINITY_DN10232_c0_g1~~TRINITY_DN10232_c0_g1_i5.p1  ORF type:complete len:270 (-),score=3.19 TRINITY_DN10232_c0_g1_i5:380-1189(-)
MLIFVCFLSILSLGLTDGADDYRYYDHGEDYYPIREYYGSKVREFYSRNAILNENTSYFNWSTFFCYDQDQNMWFADYSNNQISFYNNTFGQIVKVLGGPSKRGFHDGGKDGALFQGLSSILIYKTNETAIRKEMQEDDIMVRNETACLYVTNDNYTSCIDNSTSNDKIDPRLIKTVQNFSIPVDLKNISYLNFTDQTLFIVDKDNHCIRNYSIRTGTSSFLLLSDFRDCEHIRWKMRSTRLLRWSYRHQPPELTRYDWNGCLWQLIHI